MIMCLLNEMRTSTYFIFIFFVKSLKLYSKFCMWISAYLMNLTNRLWVSCKQSKHWMLVNVTRLIKSREIMWHVKSVEHERSKNQKYMMLVSSMLSMMHVKHVEHDTLKMYLEIYKHSFYSAEKNLLTFLLLCFF